MKYKRGSLTFNVLEFGASKGELVVLLHGFPATAESWEPVATQLAAAGFRVLVPEQRGYSSGARPQRRKDYRLSELVEDVAALLENVHAKKAHIVGHDWGGFVAWTFANKYPERTASLVAVSTPHPKALAKSMRHSKQLFLSWYVGFFQLPYLPELAITCRGGAILKRLLVRSGLSTGTAEKYAAAMQQKGRATAAINWYRALPYNRAETKDRRQIQVPTLFIYGNKDRFLSEKAAQLTKDYVAGEYEFLQLPKASHWIPEEQPEMLANKIAEFTGNLAGQRAGSRI